MALESRLWKSIGYQTIMLIKKFCETTRFILTEHFNQVKFLVDENCE